MIEFSIGCRVEWKRILLWELENLSLVLVLCDLLYWEENYFIFLGFGFYNRNKDFDRMVFLLEGFYDFVINFFYLKEDNFLLFFFGYVFFWGEK